MRPSLPASPGFSLLELALVMAVVALAGSGMLGSLQARLVNLRYHETEGTLALAVEALVGFAAADGARFPCPDADGDGLPDPGEEDACAVTEGGLPWAALGLARHDAWGQPLRYRPDRAFVLPGGLGNPPDTLDGLQVVDAADGRVLTAGNPHAPAAIVFSCGRNRVADGGNATEGAGATCNSRGRPDVGYEHGPPGARFDDALVWVSKNVVLVRLIDAGAWPP